MGMPLPSDALDKAQPCNNPALPEIERVRVLTIALEAERALNGRLEAELAEFKRRAQWELWGLQEELGKERRRNAEVLRHLPKPGMVELRAIVRLMLATFPKRPISKQALAIWCADGKKHGLVSEKRGKHVWVDLVAFRRLWQERGLPDLPWDRLRRS